MGETCTEGVGRGGDDVLDVDKCAIGEIRGWMSCCVPWLCGRLGIGSSVRRLRSFERGKGACYDFLQTKEMGTMLERSPRNLS